MPRLRMTVQDVDIDDLETLDEQEQPATRHRRRQSAPRRAPGEERALERRQIERRRGKAIAKHLKRMIKKP